MGLTHNTTTESCFPYLQPLLLEFVPLGHGVPEQLLELQLGTNFFQSIKLGHFHL